MSKYSITWSKSDFLHYELSDELLKFVMRVIVISIRSTRDLLRELLSRPNISSYSVTLCLT